VLLEEERQESEALSMYELRRSEGLSHCKTIITSVRRIQKGLRIERRRNQRDKKEKEEKVRF
jgi:hypothetical protein